LAHSLQKLAIASACASAMGHLESSALFFFSNLKECTFRIEKLKAIISHGVSQITKLVNLCAPFEY
jgi:hypothetical protein